MISLANKKDYPVLIDIWERVVKATHNFLSDEDFEFYKSHIPIYFEHVSLYIYRNEENAIKGFLGVTDDSIEMLFVENESRGTGVGKILLNYAINTLNARRVDVNEQNTQALNFYYHFGFKEIDRSEYDGEGKGYPVLHLLKSE
ncbi:GNAT family N-acetyltransferase [Dysgonomonas sp. Marseille-P4677]|uniref:GNAT family N-acetyltransferase n=1 Tax=Dysgonomonas sp. Marseille-P4677 TaxID=2364790 RepID=UPI0019137AE7|nr:GNAT family N-acetyltransferase [Dysgonomonas sp. Marseille-P4677]MBK5722329.1 GNAT family N-acetyltransferase [Dysgonomonas sp. Marseille-P4677]